MTDTDIETALERIRENHRTIQSCRAENDRLDEILAREDIEYKFNIAGTSWKRLAVGALINHRTCPTSAASMTCRRY